MQITITGRHFDVTEAIKRHIIEKIERFNKYLSNIINVHVILSVENLRHIAEIVLSVKDAEFLSKEETADIYSSVDRAVEKMEHQLRKHKEKLKNHNKKYKADSLDKKNKKDNSKPILVKDLRFLDKPMDIEEAIMQLELQEFDFFVFKDVSDDDKIKVIYKRKDKNYGLIE